jgi:hypothetical protein
VDFQAFSPPDLKDPAMSEKDILPGEAKTAAALRYLIEGLSLPPETLAEVLYLAELEHLHRWGRLITHAQYVAVRPGVRLAQAPSAGKLRLASLNDLSVSDTLVLDEMMVFARTNGPTSVKRRAKDAVWLRLRKAASTEDPVPMTMADMASLSPDAEALLAHLRDPHPGSASAVA